MIKKNETLQVVIEDLTYEGYGVAKVDGFPIFIENALPDEVVNIQIVKILKRFAFGKVLDFEKTSPDRVEVTDRIGTRVGTMPLQHMNYEAQLRFKQKMVRDTLSKQIDMSDLEVLPTLGMDHPWAYRNKAQIPVRQLNGQIETGFFKKNTHTLIPIEDYHIQDPIIDRLISGIRDILRKHNIEAYNEEKHSGVIRHVIVRRGHYSHQVMIILVTRTAVLSHEMLITQEIRELDPQIVSIVQNINTQKTNVIMGDNQKILYGTDHYEDSLLGKTYRISSRSFYQVNTLQTERLYQTALDFADIQNDEVVMDAYCGIGTITLNLADKAKQVYGVEVVDDAIRMAEYNAKANQIDNTIFASGKAETVIQDWLEEEIGFDVVVVDPPRKGLDESFIASVLKVKPKRVVYVSCNPATLARDLKLLGEGGYGVVKVQPVDMFPQTVHVETVVLLSRIKGKKSIQVDIDLNDDDLTKPESKATYQQIQEYVEEKHKLKVSSLYIAQVKRKQGIMEAENYNKGTKGSKQPNVTLEKQNAIEDALNYYQMIR